MGLRNYAILKRALICALHISNCYIILRPRLGGVAALMAALQSTLTPGQQSEDDIPKNQSR